MTAAQRKSLDELMAKYGIEDFQLYRKDLFTYVLKCSGGVVTELVNELHTLFPDMHDLECPAARFRRGVLRGSGRA